MARSLIFIDIVLCSCFFSRFFVFLSFKFFGQLLSVFFEGLPGVCLNQFVSALIALTMLGFLLGFLGGGEPMSWRND